MEETIKAEKLPAYVSVVDGVIVGRGGGIKVW